MVPALTKEICEELESDPAFFEEIRNDFLAIGAKIQAHRNKRVGVQ